MTSDDSGLAGLQFDRAEPVSPQASTCAGCGSPIAGAYYSLNGRAICEACAEMQRPQAQNASAGDFVRALLYGSGAALAGTGLYFAVLALSGYEIGLIAVAVGWLVGKAVQKGSRGIGGRKFQIMAVLLTYFSIAGSYVPLIVKHAMENPPGQKQSAPSAGTPTRDVERGNFSFSGFVIGIVVLFAYCLALPFLQGLGSIIGLFIICIGLFEAWKINRRAPLVLEGPFEAPRPVTGA